MKNKQFYTVLEGLQVLKAQVSTNCKRLKDVENSILQIASNINFFFEKSKNKIAELRGSKNSGYNQLSPFNKELQVNFKTVKELRNKLISLIKYNKNYETKINDKLESKILDIAVKYKLDVSELRQNSTAIKLLLVQNLKSMLSLQNMVVDTENKLQKIKASFERLKLPLILTQTTKQVGTLAEKVRKIFDLVKNGHGEEVKSSEEFVAFQGGLTGFIEQANKILCKQQSTSHNQMLFSFNSKPKTNSMLSSSLKGNDSGLKMQVQATENDSNSENAITKLKSSNDATNTKLKA